MSFFPFFKFLGYLLKKQGVERRRKITKWERVPSSNPNLTLIRRHPDMLARCHDDSYSHWVFPGLFYIMFLEYSLEGIFLQYVKHCLDFSFVFSAPLPARRNLFSASGIFYGRRYQPGYNTRNFWPAEGRVACAMTEHFYLLISFFLISSSFWVI